MFSLDTMVLLGVSSFKIKFILVMYTKTQLNKFRYVYGYIIYNI